MIVLDENFTAPEREKMRAWRISFRHIGYDLAKKGVDDETIIPLLLTLARPTFFTEDADFFKSRLCHVRYSLVHLAVQRDEMALYARRLLKHSNFVTRAQRMGTVIRLSPMGIIVWRVHDWKQQHYEWQN